MMDRTMRRARWIALPALLALAACAAPSDSNKPATAPGLDTSPGGVPAPEAAGQVVTDALAANLRRFFEASGSLPPGVDLAVENLKPSKIGGLNEGTLKLSLGDKKQETAFLVSADGRWFLRVDPIDLTVDPSVEVREKIKVGPDDPTRGPKDSAVTIVEYSDFQCPFCAKAERIVADELLPAYGDKVRFVYKQFPLTQIHPWAEGASLTGLCVLRVAGNDAYWKYHAAVFEKAQSIQAEGAETELAALAKSAGADPAKVKECLDKGEMKAALQATLDEAESIGVNSTPMFFVNGRRLSGAMPLESFKALIDPMLEKKG